MKPISPDDFNITITGLPYHGMVGQFTLYEPDNELKLTVSSTVLNNVRMPTSYNTLMAKIKELPDREGNQFDIDNDYVWKDRFLLAREFSTSTRAHITTFVYIDDDDIPWEMSCNVITNFLGTGATYKIYLSRRFGVFQPPSNVPIFSLLVHEFFVSFSGYPEYNIDIPTNLNKNRIKQNPRGDKILVSILGNVAGYTDNSIVNIARILISGSVDQETGLGLFVTSSTIKNLSDCMPTGTVQGSNDIKPYIWCSYQFYEMYCNGAPNCESDPNDTSTGVRSNDTGYTPFEYLEEYDSSFGIVYVRKSGISDSTETKENIVGFFYDEDGGEHFVKKKQENRQYTNRSYILSHTTIEYADWVISCSSTPDVFNWDTENYQTESNRGFVELKQFINSQRISLMMDSAEVAYVLLESETNSEYSGEANTTGNGPSSRFRSCEPLYVTNPPTYNVNLLNVEQHENWYDQINTTSTFSLLSNGTISFNTEGNYVVTIDSEVYTIDLNRLFVLSPPIGPGLPDLGYSDIYTDRTSHSSGSNIATFTASYNPYEGTIGIADSDYAYVGFI